MTGNKKTAKGRLDKYYHLAKEQGYRARSAFKLIQLNSKFEFLQNAKVLIDLCAAPGGWLQVAAKHMSTSHLIIGVDLVPIKPIPGVITLAHDITSDTCRTALFQILKDWKADVVLHDGAPNVGSAWIQDAYTQNELVLKSLKLATEMLRQGGTFVTKVFRSKDYNALLWVLTQLFKKVEVTKPDSSRTVSAEIFIVCSDYLAPKKVDPKFLDPKSVFEEMEIPVQPMNIFKPEKHTRQRSGYADDATLLLFKPATVDAFLRSNDPVAFLGTYDQLTFDAESPYLTFIKTTAEIKSACADLKLLSKGEFRSLLKWRQALCKEFLSSPKEFKQVVEEAPLSDLDELEGLIETETKQTRRNKKKMLMKRAKERERMKLGMSLDPILSQSMLDQDQDLFRASLTLENLLDVEPEEPEIEPIVKKAKVASIEDQLDFMYQTYKEKTSRPLKREPLEDNDSDTMENLQEESLDASMLNVQESKDAHIHEAQLMFSRPMFQDLDQENVLVDESELKASSARASKKSDRKKQPSEQNSLQVTFVKADDHFKPLAPVMPCSPEDNSKETPTKELFTEDDKKHLLTPEGMTLAMKLRTNSKSRKDLIDGSFHRYAFGEDPKLLPTWFRDDEERHNRPPLPVSKEAIEALKSKLKLLDSRPTKKVLEAKLRNKMKIIRKMESLKAKAGAINDNEELSEAQKAGQILKAKSKAKAKVEKKRPTLVVARGANKGVKARPKGVKGRYKMVDGRMKKETRALKRKQKAQRKSKRR